MDSIYLTKWGGYVDLSKIVSVEYGHPQGFEISIQFQLVEGKTGCDLYGNRPKDSKFISIEEDMADLVNAWKEYKGESNNDRKDAVKALVELGEELNAIKVAQPDLQPRL